MGQQCSGDRSMLSGDIILITGAAGDVGSATVHALAERFPASVIRVGSRSVSSAQERLKGVDKLEFVTLDTAQPDTVTSAFRGVKLLLIAPPTTEKIPVTATYISAAKTAGVQFVVLLSAVGNGSSPSGFEWKDLEQNIADSGINYCVIKVPIVLEVLTLQSTRIKKKSTFSAPIGANHPFSCIALSDVGYAAACVLADPVQYHNTTVTISASETTCCAEIAELLSQRLKKPIVFSEVSTDEAIKQLSECDVPPATCSSSTDLWTEAQSGALIVSSDRNSFEKITGHAAVTPKMWAGRVDTIAAFID